MAELIWTIVAAIAVLATFGTLLYLLIYFARNL